MENEETTLEGAAREVREEACAECDDLRLFAVYNLPRISQVYMMFFGRLRDGKSAVGEESLEVKLFSQNEIPWDDLAFPVVTETLMRYFERKRDRIREVHYADIFSRPGAPLEIDRHP